MDRVNTESHPPVKRGKGRGLSLVWCLIPHEGKYNKFQNVVLLHQTCWLPGISNRIIQKRESHMVKLFRDFSNQTSSSGCSTKKKIYANLSTNRWLHGNAPTPYRQTSGRMPSASSHHSSRQARAEHQGPKSNCGIHLCKQVAIEEH